MRDDLERLRNMEDALFGFRQFCGIHNSEGRELEERIAENVRQLLNC